MQYSDPDINAAIAAMPLDIIVDSATAAIPLEVTLSAQWLPHYLHLKWIPLLPHHRHPTTLHQIIMWPLRGLRIQ